MFFFTCSNSCILTLMSVFMELFLERHPNSKYLFTENDDAKGPNRLKAKYLKVLWEEVWRNPEFIYLAPEASPLHSHDWPTNINTHSGRKCPAEYAVIYGANTRKGAGLYSNTSIYNRRLRTSK